MKSTRSLSLAVLCAIVAAFAMLQAAPSSAVQGQQPTSTVLPTLPYPTFRPIPTLTPGPTITPSGPLVVPFVTQMVTSQADQALTIGYRNIVNDAPATLAGFPLEIPEVYEGAGTYWYTLILVDPQRTWSDARKTLVSYELRFNFYLKEEDAYSLFNWPYVSNPHADRPPLETLDADIFIQLAPQQPDGRFLVPIGIMRFRNVLVSFNGRFWQSIPGSDRFSITPDEVRAIFRDIKTWLAKER